MEDWSHKPELHFRTKVYFDTQILSFIIDETFPSINKVIKWLDDCPFVDLSTSRYVFFELVGIRKREHHIREIIKKNMPNGGINTINFSSFYKYLDQYSHNDYAYKDLKNTIIQNFENDLLKLTDLNIDLSSHLLHDDLINPTKDLCLNSKISKEDCLMICASMFPDKNKTESFALILSNDSNAVTFFNEEDFSKIFSSNSLNKPIVECIKHLRLNNGKAINLLDQHSSEEIHDFLLEKIKEMLISKGKAFFLGYTTKPPQKQTQIVTFNLCPNTDLEIGKYITIIGKNLDFILTSNERINEFQDGEKIETYPYHKAEKIDVAFIPIFDSELDQDSKDAIMSKLREKGNLVFVHPDSN